MDQMEKNARSLYWELLRKVVADMKQTGELKITKMPKRVDLGPAGVVNHDGN